MPYYKPADDTPEMQYLHERRKALGGYLPQRRTRPMKRFTVPALDTFKAMLEPTAEGREISTTHGLCAFLDAAAARQGHRPARGARSWWTRPAPLAWKACSANSASTTPKARTTPR